MTSGSFESECRRGLGFVEDKCGLPVLGWMESGEIDTQPSRLVTVLARLREREFEVDDRRIFSGNNVDADLFLAGVLRRRRD